MNSSNLFLLTFIFIKEYEMAKRTYNTKQKKIFLHGKHQKKSQIVRKIRKPQRKK